MLSWFEHEKSFITSGPVLSSAYILGRLYCKQYAPGPGVIIKAFFMLNSTQHKISTAHKNSNTEK